jgi:hypothetical protein
MNPSTQFSLNWLDVGKAFVMAGLVVVVFGLQTSLSAGAFPTGEEWGKIGIAALNAGIAYLIKNFFSGTGTTKEV